MDFYSLVPQDYAGNLEYRMKFGRLAAKDRKFQAAIREACREDFTYFASAWAWLHEPRQRYGPNGKPLPRQIPFTPWPHQLPAIKAIRDSLGKCDIGVEKSRDEGATWTALWLAIQDFLFAPEGYDIKIGLVSSTADMSDEIGNKDSLGGKIDWAMSKLPSWMVGKRGVDYGRKKGLLENYRNGSEISFWSAVPDLGRGGRYMWFFLDELASDSWQREGKDEKALDATGKSTDSRLFVSTPNGTTGAYYRMMHAASGTMTRVQLKWQDNPTKNRGLYKIAKDKILAVDPQENPLTKAYDPPSFQTVDMFSRLRRKGFQLEKGVRSPWYDNECDKADARPHTVAKELDLDYGGSMYHVFGAEVMATLDRTVQQPYARGHLTVTSGDKYEFETMANGPFLLWCTLDAQGNPPESQYTIACDVSSGLGGTYTSNSALVIVDIQSRVQVGELAINTMEPYDFCRTALAASKWFHNAYLAWEHMGPGTGFTKQVMDSGYGHFFKRKVTWRKRNRTTFEPGWVMSDKTKEIMCNDLIAAVREGEVLVRSKDMRDEFPHYVRLGGKITHALIKNATEDALGASHGDRVIAMGLAVQAMRDRPQPARAEPQEKVWSPNEPPPYGTLASRNWQHRLERQRLTDDWDHTSTAELRLPKGSQIVLSY